jgi:hypothetical protein
MSSIGISIQSGGTHELQWIKIEVGWITRITFFGFDLNGFDSQSHAVPKQRR